MFHNGAALHASMAMHVLAKEMVSATPDGLPISVHSVAAGIRLRFPKVILSDADLVRIAAEVAIGQARPVVFDREVDE